MKKSIKQGYLIGITILSMLSLVQAQEKNTFYVGYGFGTHDDFQTFWQSMISAMMTLGAGSFNSEKNTGSIYAGYRRAITERWELGGFLAYEGMKIDMRVLDQYRFFKKHNYSAALEARYNYLSREKIRLYSGLAAGLSLHRLREEAVEDNYDDVDRVDDDLRSAFQFDAIGISYGKRFAPFISIGWGYKGLLSVGLQTSF